MRKFKNLTGQIFNGLTFLYPVKDENDHLLAWKCLCHCGKEFNVRGSCISLGAQKSCGCLSGNPKHREKNTVLYTCWKGIRERCLNPNKKQYKDYGGRGIKICERWNEYLKFKEDMLPTYKLGLTIDRINNDGDYEPSNCKWSTRAEQNSNTRRNHYFETPTGKKTIAEIAKTCGLSEHTIRHRIMYNAGITFEQLILPAKPGVSLKQRIKLPA